MALRLVGPRIGYSSRPKRRRTRTFRFPPARLPGSDYDQHATRLFLESVDPKQLAAFAHQLTQSDAALHPVELSLRRRDGADATFDVELSVGYLYYAPKSS